MEILKKLEGKDVMIKQEQVEGLPAKLKKTTARVIQGGNCNDIIEKWVIMASDKGTPQNYPTGLSYFYLNTILMDDSEGNRAQIAYSYTGTNKIFFRRKFSGTWSAWSQVL